MRPETPGNQGKLTLTGHTSYVLALAVAPDGSWLASASDDATVRIWDPRTGQTRHTLTGHTSRVRGVGGRPGRHLAGLRQLGQHRTNLGRRRSTLCHIVPHR